MSERLLLYGLVTERLLVGSLATAAPEVFARMFGIRHIALGAALFLARKDARLLAQLAGLNAAVEVADAAALLADRRTRAALVATLGGLGCLMLSHQAFRKIDQPRIREARAE